MLIKPPATFRRGSVPIFGLALLLAACGGEPPPAPEPDAVPAVQRGYVGAEACAGCHAEEAAAWRASRHSAIFRPGDGPAWQGSPPPAWSTEDLEVYPEETAEGAAMRVARGGALGTFDVDAVLGGKRMESYATLLGDGAWLLLPLNYKVQEQAMAPYTRPTCGVELFGTSGLVGWQSFERVWNHRCIDCHVTAGDIGFDLASLTYDTSWVDNGAACEACHGPGAEHIAAAREGRPEAGLAEADMQVCAACHALALPFNSRWGGPRPFRPGDDYWQAFLPLLRPAESGPFAALTHADHTPATGVMEYQGLSQSLCHLEGQADCATCHDPHTGQAAGDAACAGCHADIAAAPAEHSRHEPGRPGGACVDCHMAPTVSALGTRLASHAIDVPLPVNNLEFGVPDACTLCHADRGAEWADVQYREMWGDPEGRRRRRLTLAFNTPDADALRALLSNPDEAPLLRADAAAALARVTGVEAAPDLIAILDDGEAPLVVRRFAADLLGGMGAPASALFQQKADHLQRLQDMGVHDVLRRAHETGEPVLRLGAASALARLGAEDGLRRLEALRDDPALAHTYRLHQALGRYYMLSNRLEEAAEAYEKVLATTPNYLDVIKDLGFIYFSSERFEKARDLWMRGLVLAPGDTELSERIHLAEDEMRKQGMLAPPEGS